MTEDQQTQQDLETLGQFLSAEALERIMLEVVELPDELTEPLRDLTAAIRRASSELEGHDEHSDRIAALLLTALARFSSETGLPC